MNRPLILIDARLFGPKNTGIGRYTQNLLLSLKNQPHFSRYRFGLIVKTESLPEISSLFGNSYQYFPTTISHYSLAEQLLLPGFIKKINPNLVHFTHFNKPLFYFGKSVVTIHDLIKHHFKGQNTTTKNSFFYWPKYFIYRLITDFTINHNSLIVPSNFWRQQIIADYHLPPHQITTTHEAVDPSFLSSNASKSYHSKVLDYIIYTGNLYPHKNVAVILQALTLLPQIKLKIISSRDIFQKRLAQLAQDLGVASQVEFLGFLPDSQFAQVYASAIALVHPSFMEGFSLTGLEAMALSCPVIAANSSCLPEIYQQSVLYFPPTNYQLLAQTILKLQSTPSLRRQLITQGHRQLKKYSWDNTAKLTLSVYEKNL